MKTLLELKNEMQNIEFRATETSHNADTLKRRAQQLSKEARNAAVEYAAALAREGQHA